MLKIRMPEKTLPPGTAYVAVIEVDEHGNEHQRNIAANSFSITPSGALVVGIGHTGDRVGTAQVAFNKRCWTAAWVDEVCELPRHAPHHLDAL